MSQTLPKFIVVFKDGVTSKQITEYINNLKGEGGEVKDRWDEGGILNGFAIAIPEDKLSSFKSFNDDQIAYIEKDGVVTIQK